jgi:hypothetical protein
LPHIVVMIVRPGLTQPAKGLIAHLIGGQRSSDLRLSLHRLMPSLYNHTYTEWGGQ